ncbi:hypothetical protein SS50377_20224 [Spironucleus salmonicida]|uniref:Uncharacterized protein n=1 Tax=Spironucleus salmonicida TaxID=348837 RepID=V6LKX2_9EUKA|nr:hypothetical protein SS50377_20224 [Spironucleus salmonicida]|eukprot:EST45280.1 Hypothetical protein SS50377_14856 [Spironucleus salmonicida]
MQNIDEFGLLEGNTSNFKDFMGGGNTVDLLQFLGQSTGPVDNYQTQMLQINNENIQLKQQIQQLQQQVFQYQNQTEQLQKQILQSSLDIQQVSNNVTFEAQIQELFEANQIYENQIKDFQANQLLQQPNQLEQELTYLLQVHPNEITNQVTNLMNQVTYYQQKHEKDAAEIEFFKIQAARQLQVFKENVVMLRKQTEKTLGWRVNIMNDYQIRVERQGQKGLYFDLEQGKIVGSSFQQHAFNGEPDIQKILARVVLQ